MRKGVSLVSFNGLGAKGRHNPPLAPLLLAPVAQQAGFPCDILDVPALERQNRLRRGGERFMSDAARLICDRDNRYICFSTRCDTYPYVIEVARQCKRLSPESVVVLGGPQATSTDLLTLQSYPFVDVVARGEGEQVFPALLRALEGGRDLAAVTGISYRAKGGDACRNAAAPLIVDLDTMPFPDFELYDALYENIEPAYGDLELGRGCPFACNFCFTSIMWNRKYRVRSVRSLIELAALMRKRYGLKQFRFIHDNVFFMPGKFIDELVREFPRRLPDVTWSASTRVDTLDTSLLPALKSAGLSDLYFGIETGIDSIQDELGKKFPIARVLQVLSEMERSKVSATVSFIVGFPSETRDDLERTLSFALRCAIRDNVKCLQFHSLAPAAATGLYQALRGGLEYLGVYSNHNGEIRMSERSILALVRSNQDIFSSFYTIKRDHYPVDLPFVVQEVLGCLYNFYPMTIWVLTQELGLKILDFLDAVLVAQKTQGRAWRYGREPRISLTRVVRESYALQGKDDATARALCRFETFIHSALMEAHKAGPTPHRGPGLHRPPTTKLLASRRDPYALFEAFLKGADLSRIPRSYHICHASGSGRRFSVRILEELEHAALRLIDGHRSVAQVLDSIESRRGFYRSAILRRHLSGLISELTREGFFLEMKSEVVAEGTPAFSNPRMSLKAVDGLL